MSRHGRPDWIRSTTLQDVRDVFGNIPEVSMGELAARLGSINYFERRGEVVFMDDFEDSTLKWEVTGTGTDHSEVRSNATARSKNYSMKLTTGNAGGNIALMKHYHYMPKLKRLGFEYSFALGSDITLLYNLIYLYTKTAEYIVWMQYAPQSNRLQIVDVNNDIINVATSLDLKEGDLLFHTWKIVVDLDTEKYVRILLNDTEYDVSASFLKKTLGSYTPHMYLYIGVLNYASGNHYAYIDDVIFTQNES